MNLTSRRPGVVAVLAASLFSCAGAQAGDFDSLGLLSQDDFERLVENLGAATHYKAVSPGEPLGTIGFDIGLEASYTELDDEVFDRADDGDFERSSLVMLRLHAHKGLPFGLDIGAFVGALPGTDLTVIGAELRYALLEGGLVTPALGLRASFSSLQGASELDLNNAGLELVISKGVINLTPYAGAGIVHTNAEARETDLLDDVSTDQGKVFVGLNVNLGLNLAFEYDRTGEDSTLSAKAGIRF